MRMLARGGDKRGDKRRGGKDQKKVAEGEVRAGNEAPKRIESLLISNQIGTYCDHVQGGSVYLLLFWIAFCHGCPSEEIR